MDSCGFFIEFTIQNTHFLKQTSSKQQHTTHIHSNPLSTMTVPTTAAARRGGKGNGMFKIMCVILPYFLIGYSFLYIHFLQQFLQEEIRNNTQQNAHRLRSEQEEENKQQQEQIVLSLSNHKKELELQTKQQQKQVSFLQDQLTSLQHKFDSYLGWGQNDPFYSSRIHTTCEKLKNLQGAGHAYTLCMDDFPYQDCIVYEFGIRTEADFGLTLMESPYHCQVHAFDPSPITKTWYNGPSPTAMKLQRKKPENWKLHHYGGGYADEILELKEYNWDQVSLYQYPPSVVNPQNCTNSGHCKYNRYKVQNIHKLPVRSVESIMKELQHDRITILKLDVEGSEYRMLENIIDSGICRKIDQIVLEWHHYEFDLRYGASSIPIHNVFHTMLKEKCGLEQFWIHDPTGWPSNEKLYADMGIILRYNLASFKRTTSYDDSRSNHKNKTNTTHPKSPVFFTNFHKKPSKK